MLGIGAGGVGREQEIADVGAGEVDLGANPVEVAGAFEEGLAEAGFLGADTVEDEKGPGAGGENEDEETAEAEA